WLAESSKSRRKGKASNGRLCADEVAARGAPVGAVFQMRPPITPWEGTGCQSCHNDCCAAGLNAASASPRMTAGPRRSSGRDEQMFGDEQQIPHEAAGD